MFAAAVLISSLSSEIESVSASFLAFGDIEKKSQHDRGEEHAGPSIAYKGHGESGDRKQPASHTGIDESVEHDGYRAAGRHQHPQRILRPPGNEGDAPYQNKTEQENDRSGAEQTVLLGDDREDEIVVGSGQEIALGALADTDSQKAASCDGDPGLLCLIAAPRFECRAVDLHNLSDILFQPALPLFGGTDQKRAPHQADQNQRGDLKGG